MIPQVSVIIPTYNRAVYLRDCIESAFSQSVKDLDVWVVDDGSTDDTPEVIKQIRDPRFHYIRIPHSGLPAVARNVGIRNSRSRYVAFLDSDDLWLPDKLKKQIKAAVAQPGASVFYSFTENFDDSGRLGPPVRYHGKRSGRVYRELLSVNFIPILTVMMPRDVLETVGFFDEHADFKAIEDYDLILRAAAHSDVHCTPEVLALHRVHSGNIWSYDLATIDRLEKAIFKNLNISPVPLAVENKTLAELNYQRFKLSVAQSSDAKLALGFINKIIQYRPFSISGYCCFFLIQMGMFPFIQWLYRTRVRWKKNGKN